MKCLNDGAFMYEFFRENNDDEQLGKFEWATADVYYGRVTNINIHQFLVTQKNIRKNQSSLQG